VQATSGEISTVDDVRDHAQASPRGRFTAPLKRIHKFIGAQVSHRPLIDRIEQDAARLRVLRLIDRLNVNARGNQIVRERRGRTPAAGIPDRRRSLSSANSFSHPTTQPVPRLCSATSTCPSPSSRTPATATAALSRSGTRQTPRRPDPPAPTTDPPAQPLLHADDLAVLVSDPRPITDAETLNSERPRIH
jgi:hypothetical protein